MVQELSLFVKRLLDPYLGPSHMSPLKARLNPGIIKDYSTFPQTQERLSCRSISSYSLTSRECYMLNCMWDALCVLLMTSQFSDFITCRACFGIFQ